MALAARSTIVIKRVILAENALSMEAVLYKGVIKRVKLKDNVKEILTAFVIECKNVYASIASEIVQPRFLTLSINIGHLGRPTIHFKIPPMH